MEGLKGRIVAITGGAGDIGSATADRLARSGAKTYLLDIVREEAGQQRCAETGACGYYQCSQTERAAVETALADIVARESRLDVMIINAARTSPATIADLDMNEWREIVELNLNGAVECAQAALLLMLRQERRDTGVRGKILFTGSQCQKRPEHGGVAYQVTKRAVERFMEQLAYDYAADGVLANMLVPGILMAGLTKRIVLSSAPHMRDTLLDRIPIGEFGTAEQSAAAFAFLCSADSDYMTGACLTVDGGCVLGRAEKTHKSFAG
jgi:NAD(P)-dependent dehydrogenase (short-subunit alcohol dehydrogenase family)